MVRFGMFLEISCAFASVHSGVALRPKDHATGEISPTVSPNMNMF